MGDVNGSLAGGTGEGTLWLSRHNQRIPLTAVSNVVKRFLVVQVGVSILSTTNLGFPAAVAMLLPFPVISLVNPTVAAEASAVLQRLDDLATHLNGIKFAIVFP